MPEAIRAVVAADGSRLHLDRDQRARLAALAGKRVEIVCWRSRRSKEQNDYWWAVPVTVLAEHLGYEPDQMHYALLGEWRGYVDGPHGTPVPRCASSSSLTTAEFTELIAWVQRWAAEYHGVDIPAPNET